VKNVPGDGFIIILAGSVIGKNALNMPFPG
jgi:hypothetical protein